jgi:hypothetical protein
MKLTILQKKVLVLYDSHNVQTNIAIESVALIGDLLYGAIITFS